MDSKIIDSCPPYLRDFLFYMETIKGRSVKTVEAYFIDLRSFLRFLKLRSMESVNVKSITAELLTQTVISDVPMDTIAAVTLSQIYEYLNFTLSVGKNNARTRARKVSAIKSFFKYLTTKANPMVLKTNPAEQLEVPSVKKSLPKYLTLPESLELLGSQDKWKNPGSRLRDYCMIVLFINLGIRLSELVGLNLQSIKDNTITVTGKGNKERMIYLNDACVNAIQEYLPERSKLTGVVDKDALFLSSRGIRISARRVEQIVGDALKLAGLSGKGYSPHKLRHTAATLMYQYGHVDIRVLQEILGHENLATTEIYTHTSSSQIAEAVARSPLSGKKRGEDKKEEPS